jgi:hypothetical protein
MALVTREELGRKLTIQEMDGNLTYLDAKASTGVVDETTYTSVPVTTEQVLSMTLIPANTFKNLDAVQMQALLIKKTEFGALQSVTAYLNTSASLQGANQFTAPFYSSINVGINVVFINNFISVIKQGKIIGSISGGVGTSLPSLLNFASASTTEIPFDPTIDNYLIVTIAINNALDVVTQESLIFKKIN